MKHHPPAADGLGQQRYYGRLAKVGLVWGMLRVGGNSLLLIPASAVLARLLTPEDFGAAAAAYFFTALAARLTNVGFGASLVRLKDATREHQSSVFVVSLALAIGTWVVLSATAGAIGRFFDSPETAAILPVAAVGFIVVAFGVVPTALMSRDMRYRQSTTSDWIATITNIVVSIWLAWLGLAFWSLVYGRLAEDIVRTLARVWIVRWTPRLAFSGAAMRDVFSFGAGVQAKSLLDYSAQNLDNLIVGRTLGIGPLGFYDKAFGLVGKILANINVSGPSVTFRVFALIHEDRERFRRAYRKVIMSITLVGYPLLCGLAVSAPELIDVLFGAQWHSSVAPFQILCVAAMFKLLNMYASSATQAKGQVWSEVKRQVIHVALLVGAVTFFSRWGIAGAAFGVLLSTAAMTVLFQVLVQRLTRLDWRDMLGPQLPAMVCTGGLAVVLLATKAGMRLAAAAAPAWTMLLLLVGVGGLFYLAFILFSPYSEVRGVVHETARDLAPGIARRLTWLTPRPELPAMSGR
jgi:PST family polysaccharide transporter